MMRDERDSTYYCTECAKTLSARFTAVHNSSKFKCPEGNCRASLSFEEFISPSCCSVAIRKSKDGGLDRTNPIEFQDLEKTMKLFEVLTREENQATEFMGTKKKKYDRVTANYDEQKECRKKKQKDFTSSLFDETNTIKDHEEKDEDPSLLRQKLQNIKNWIASLECDIRNEGYRKTDMEKAKKIFDDATNTFEKKKEDREQVKRQLAGLLLDTGRSLNANKGRKIY
ncbi:unnamed protein product [Oikopleura dioica]|nr:unnamed protein product [Oikopleura dioica]